MQCTGLCNCCPPTEFTVTLKQILTIISFKPLPSSFYELVLKSDILNICKLYKIKTSYKAYSSRLSSQGLCFISSTTLVNTILIYLYLFYFHKPVTFCPTNVLWNNGPIKIRTLPSTSNCVFRRSCSLRRRC